MGAQTPRGVGEALGIPTPASPFDTAFEIDTLWRWLVLGAFFIFFTAATLLLQSRKGRS